MHVDVVARPIFRLVDEDRMNRSRLWFHFFVGSGGYIKLSWATKLVWNEMHNPAYINRFSREPIGNVVVRLA